MPACLVPLQNNKTHACLEGHADQVPAGCNIDRLDSLLLESCGIGWFPGCNDRKGRAVFLNPGELLFEMRIFRKSDKIHPKRAFAHDLPEALQVLLQLHATFHSQGHRGKASRLGYSLGEFRYIADPGHGTLDKGIFGPQRPCGRALRKIVKFVWGLPTETHHFLFEGPYGLKG